MDRLAKAILLNSISKSTHVSQLPREYFVLLVQVRKCFFGAACRRYCCQSAASAAVLIRTPESSFENVNSPHSSSHRPSHNRNYRPPFPHNTVASFASASTATTSPPFRHFRKETHTHRNR